MEALTDKYGTDAVLWALRFLMIRCSSRPEAADLGAEMGGVRSSLKTRQDAWETARDERIVANAEIAYCDSVVDDSVMTLARNANALVEGNTDDPRYARMLGPTPSEELKPTGGRDQATYVDHVLQVLADPKHADDYATLQPFKKAIAVASADLKKATARRDKLVVTESVASSALAVETAAARDTYNHAWHRVNILFPNNKTLAESFFRTLSPPRANPANDAPPAATAAPAEPSVAVSGTAPVTATRSRKAARSSRRRR